MLRTAWASLAAALAWAAAALHASAVLPLVAAWESGLEHAEESTKAFIRETFGLFTGALNDAGVWVLSAVDGSYAESRQRTWQRQQAWHHWWREDRTSTLNAVVANARGGDGSGSGGGGSGSLTRSSSGGASAARPPSRVAELRATSEALETRRPSESDSERGWTLASLLRLRRPSAASADGGASSDGAETPPAQRQQIEARLKAAAVAAAARGGLRPSLLSRASAPSRRHEERRAYAKRREERAAAFEAAGWWGVHEALNRPGLLEGTRLSLEVAVTRAFDWLRWLVRRVTLSLRPAAGVGVRPRPRRGVEPSPRPRRGGGAGAGVGPDDFEPPPSLQLRPRRRRPADDSQQQEDTGDRRQQQQQQQQPKQLTSALRRRTAGSPPPAASLSAGRGPSPLLNDAASDEGSGDEAGGGGSGERPSGCYAAEAPAGPRPPRGHSSAGLWAPRVRSRSFSGLVRARGWLGGGAVQWRLGVLWR